jgi:hypothetical protein
VRSARLGRRVLVTIAGIVAGPVLTHQYQAEFGFFMRRQARRSYPDSRTTARVTWGVNSSIGGMVD